MVESEGSGPTPETIGRGFQFVRTAALLVIVVAGLKASTTLIVPLLLAGFIALIFMPLMKRLMAVGAPSFVAVIVVVLLVLVAIFTVSVVLGDSVGKFSASVGQYDTKLDKVLDGAVTWLREVGVKVPEGPIAEVLDSNKIMKLVSDTMSSIVGALSNFVLILFFVIFMLFEAVGLPEKLRMALAAPDSDLREFHRATGEVYKYLAIKALVSLITGVLAGIFTAAVGLDFPMLWGLTAFLFNFIPNIGSIIAAIPPILLALIQYGWGTAGLVAGGYVAIGTVIGNVVEPKWMGARLGLSPLIVIVSLVFWNWVLGPIGMLLSVPLTMVVKILLENTDDYRWVAILLGPSPPPAEAEGGADG